MKLTKIISIVLLIFLIIPFTTALTSEKIYFLDLEYDKGSLKLLDISLITGNPLLSKDTSLPYKLELLSINKEILYEGFFDIPNKIFAPPPIDPEEKSGIIELDYVKFSLSLPYYKNGNLIKISKDEKELLIVNVSRFSIYCGDSICQANENNQNCPQDCKPKEEPDLLEEIVDSLEKEPKAEKQEVVLQEQQKIHKSKLYLWIIIPTIILAILLIIFFIFRRKKLEPSDIEFESPPTSGIPSIPPKSNESQEPSTGSKFKI